jgi:membrane-associated phospholipid phosphatase
MMQRLAKLTSNILNPFLVSFSIIVLLSFESAAGLTDAIKWSLISVVLSVLPVFAFVVYLVHNNALDSIFISPRHQRNRIYLLAIGCAVVGCIVLIILGAPKLLIATFVSGLVAIVVFMAINLSWKISLHTAFITASVIILIIVYGAIVALAALLVPLVGWARIETKLHSPAQVATGALLAAGIVLIVFQLFGMIVW